MSIDRQQHMAQRSIRNIRAAWPAPEQPNPQHKRLPRPQDLVRISSCNMDDTADITWELRWQ